MDQTRWTYRSRTEGNVVNISRLSAAGAPTLPSHFRLERAVVLGHQGAAPLATAVSAALNPVRIQSGPSRAAPGGTVEQFGSGSPINPIPGFAQRIPLPGPAGAIGSVVGVLGGVTGVTDLLCRYFPSLCNIATPGARFPTPDERTPAPGLPGAREGVVGRPIGGCPSGFHLNKGTYWTLQGVVYPGTRCVKNRRMNPLNPRALRRAIRREGSFEHFALHLGMRKPATGRLKPKGHRH